jgi:hypothetical protein
VEIVEPRGVTSDGAEEAQGDLGAQSRGERLELG